MTKINKPEVNLKDDRLYEHFWPVFCKGAPGGAKALRAILEQERDQIWAEALAMYNSLRDDPDALERALQMDTPELQAAAKKAQNAASRRWRRS